jgi:hypothetical protein
MSIEFIILGAQKAGSTFLHQCLREHPSVSMPVEEIPYFESPDYEGAGAGAFESRFGERRPGIVFGIKRPSYLARPEVPARIHAHLPAAKLVAVLRNPVDRAVSAYFHYMRNGFLPLQDVNQGLRSFLEGEIPEKYPAARDILEYGLYATQLRRYQPLFPAEQMRILLHDDIVDNGLKAVQGVYAFLGVDPEYVPRGIHSRPQAVLYDPVRLRLAIFAGRLRYRKSEDNRRVFVRSGAWPSRFAIRAMSAVDWHLLRKVFGNKKPILHADLRAGLLNHFRSEIDELEGILNRKLTAWKG